MHSRQECRMLRRRRVEMEIRKLTQEEKVLTKPLYEEAFPEDTPPLVEYYYSRKMADNEVWAAMDSGRAVGMLCLNPYRVMVRGQEYPLSYIVAVATAKTHRRRGIMRQLLTAALRSQCAAGLPFTFLKPANVAYYTPFGFAFASEREHRRLKRESGMTAAGGGAEIVPFAEDAAAAAMQFMNRYLAERFEVYCYRDALYMERLLAEVEAAGGHAELLCDREKGKIAGIRIWDYQDVPEENCRLLAEERFTEPAIDKKSGEALNNTPFLMARILSLPAFLERISLRKEAAQEACVRYFRFRDELLPENNGLWRWSLNREESHIEAVQEVPGSPESEAMDAPNAVPEFTPARMARWLLGGEACSAAAWCGDIRPYRGVYFDEET